MQLEFQPLTTELCEVGESPVYDERTNALLYCDILPGILYRVPLDGRARQSWRVGGTLGSFGLCESGRLIMAVNCSVGFFDLATGTFDKLCDLDADVPEARLNDGKVGPDGAFWVGTIHEPPELSAPPPGAGLTPPAQPRKAIGAFFRVAPDGSARRIADGYRGHNGLAFSPDGRTLYHADTGGPFIDRWTLDPATGAVSGRTRFATLTHEQGRPDGAAVDVDGCYWSAGVTAACLNRFAPDGTMAETIPVPVGAPTMPCFGGPGLRTLFVTSLRHTRTAELLARYPWTGRVIAAPSPIAGLPIARFRDV